MFCIIIIPIRIPVIAIPIQQTARENFFKYFLREKKQYQIRLLLLPNANYRKPRLRDNLSVRCTPTDKPLFRDSDREPTNPEY